MERGLWTTPKKIEVCIRSSGIIISERFINYGLRCFFWCFYFGEISNKTLKRNAKLRHKINRNTINKAINREEFYCELASGVRCTRRWRESSRLLFFLERYWSESCAAARKSVSKLLSTSFIEAHKKRFALFKVSTENDKYFHLSRCWVTRY